jgi:polysaccharide export outer membrane protein
MTPVLVVRAFRLLILAAVAALGLGGCMQTAGAVAVAQPRSDRDYMA